MNIPVLWLLNNEEVEPPWGKVARIRVSDIESVRKYVIIKHIPKIKKEKYKMNEQSNNVLAEEFRFFMTWGKYRDYKNLKLLISEPNDVRLAVDKAYTDMSTRTIKGLSLEFKGNEALKKVCKDEKWEETKNSLIDGCKKQLTDSIIELFKPYAKATENKTGAENSNIDFSEKLVKISNHFLDDYKSAMEILNNSILKVPNSTTYRIDVENIKYGKAQKVVNMTCKYLMLFSDASDYKKVFQQCEMPLDSKILEYYNEIIVKSLNESRNNEIQKCTTAWSNLEYEEYKDIQKNIKEFCERNKNNDLNLTGYPLIDEFTIWKNQINK